MRKILFILLFIPFVVKGQQTYWTPGVPPSSTGFSPTWRYKVGSTDSLNTVYLLNGTKSYWIPTYRQMVNYVAAHGGGISWVSPDAFNNTLAIRTIGNGLSNIAGINFEGSTNQMTFNTTKFEVDTLATFLGRIKAPNLGYGTKTARVAIKSDGTFIKDTVTLVSQSTANSTYLQINPTADQTLSLGFNNLTFQNGQIFMPGTNLSVGGDFSFSGTNFNLGSNFSFNGGLLYGTGSGDMGQAINATYNSQDGGYLGVGDAAVSTGAATAVFNSTYHLGVQMPYMTQAQRLAIPLGNGNNTGLIVYQTDNAIGYWELQSSNSSSDWRRILTTDDITSGGGTWGSITGTLSAQTDLQTALDAKQATLISGTNIKTINSTSLLGSSNILLQTPLTAGTDYAIPNSNTTGSAAKWTTARNVAITGDLAWNVNVDGSGNATASGTLATVNSNTGTFGDASHTLNVTYNAKGLATAVSTNSIQIAESQVTNLTTDLAGKEPTQSGTGYVKSASGTKSYITAIPNADLANSAITLNGASTSLGGSFTVTKNNTDTTSTGFLPKSNLYPLGDVRYYTKTQADAKYALQATTISSGNGLIGGGSLASNRTLSADTSILVSKTFAGKYVSTNSDASLNSLSLLQTASPTYSRGRLFYDTGNESLTFFNNDSNIGLQIGQEEWVQVKNSTGSTIANGSSVYINGSSSGVPTIALAQSNSATTTIGLGLTTESIVNGAIGYVTVLGVVHGLNTSLFAVGPIYIDPTTPGALTQTVPTSPNYRYRIGFVTVVDASVGAIHVTPSTAALGNGTANQVWGINNAGTAQEFKSIIGTQGVVPALTTANQIGIGLGNIIPISINTVHLPANTFQTPLGTSGTDSIMVKIGSTGKIGAVSPIAFGGSTGANPTASLGLTAVNGLATTFMRSDAAPALSQSITPTWTGLHTFSNNTPIAFSGSAPVINFSNGGTIAMLGGPMTFNGAFNVVNNMVSIESPGNAGSTAGQIGTSVFGFKNNLWNGSNVQRADQIQAIPSTTIQLAHRLAFYMSSTSNTSQAGGNEPLSLYYNGTSAMAGFQTTLPTSFVHIGAGTSTIAPFGLTSGTDLTAAIAGKFEYNGTRLAFSPATTRKRILLSNDVAPANGQIPIGNATDFTIATPTGTQGVTIATGSGTLAVGLGAITPSSISVGLAGTVGVVEGTGGRVGQTALVAGTKAITVTGITTSSRAFVTLVTPGGTSLTTSYQAVCTANTITLQANVAAGTINVSDTSTLNYLIIN